MARDIGDNRRRHSARLALRQRKTGTLNLPRTIAPHMVASPTLLTNGLRSARATRNRSKDTLYTMTARGNRPCHAGRPSCAGRLAMVRSADQPARVSETQGCVTTSPYQAARALTIQSPASTLGNGSTDMRAVRRQTPYMMLLNTTCRYKPRTLRVGELATRTSRSDVTDMPSAKVMRAWPAARTALGCASR